MRYRTGAAGEETPPPILVPDSDAVLLTGRRAFRSRDTSRISALIDADRARQLRATDQLVVRHRRVPPTAGGVDPDEVVAGRGARADLTRDGRTGHATDRSEEHTSELQS